MTRRKVFVSWAANRDIASVASVDGLGVSQNGARSFSYPAEGVAIRGTQSIGMATTATWGQSKTWTILVDGRVVKHRHRLVGIDLAPVRRAIEESVDYAMSRLGDGAWTAGMHPEIYQGSFPRARPRSWTTARTA